MRIVVAGVNHATAPVDIRERLTIPAGEVPAALALLQPLVREGFILSTCNRTEVYGVVGQGESGADLLLRFLADRAGCTLDEIRGVAYVHTDRAAMRHALRVASGLDSMVLGEDQIQSQMKRALVLARDAGMLGASLDRVGSAALACGKRVRAFTGVGRHAVSLESLAVRAAREQMAETPSPLVVIVGAGESAALVARHLMDVPGARVTIASRSLARASAVASAVGADARRLTELPLLLVHADVVFACTSSVKPVLTCAHLRRRLSERPDAHLLCIDLGMPRDIDETLASLSGVSVVTLDKLSKLADAHRRERREHIPAAEAIVTAEAERLEDWLNARGVAHTITLLNAHADAIAQAEIGRLLPRLRSIDPRHQELVSELAHRIVRKLLHTPIVTMKNHPDAEHMTPVVETLFGLEAKVS